MFFWVTSEPVFPNPPTVVNQIQYLMQIYFWKKKKKGKGPSIRDSGQRSRRKLTFQLVDSSLCPLAPLSPGCETGYSHILRVLLHRWNGAKRISWFSCEPLHDCFLSPRFIPVLLSSSPLLQFINIGVFSLLQLPKLLYKIQGLILIFFKYKRMLNWRF